MPKLFHCHDCGRQILKTEAVVSRFTGRAWCTDKKTCAKAKAKRIRQAARAAR